jgi:uncharacterized 2Fe-2S/4Fe-4S cluster protein (DUF4445 family)
MTSGMRAVKGAIQAVSIQEKTWDVGTTTIGSDKPRGLCGSGYIDLVCELLRHGIVDKNGKINRSIKNKRIRESLAGYEFVVVFARDAGNAEDIVITDADLDNFKRSKAAIYSGISILARHMEMSMDAISKIYVAGGFGTALNIEKAIQIGLLPDLKRDKYTFVGNSSLAGARQNLFSYQVTRVAQEVSKNITYFELSTDAAYMDEYMAALFFPHTDLNKFPSVAYAHK